MAAVPESNLPLVSKPEELLQLPGVVGTLVAVVFADGKIRYRWDGGVPAAHVTAIAALLTADAIKIMKENG